MTAPPPDRETASCRILVVDDDPQARGLILAGLKGGGYDAEAVADGPRAVELASTRRFHLAVVDLMMPGMDGLETMDGLRKADPAIEIVLVTGHESERLAEEAMRRGAYAYLIKPFDILELEALIPGLYEKVSLKALVGLYETARSAFAEVKLKELLPGLMELARRILDCDDASVMLLAENGMLRVAAASGLDPAEWGKIEIGPGERVAGRVAQWKTGVTINGPLSADPRFADLPSRGGIQFSLVYPILLKEELVGILCASRKTARPPFTPQDLRHTAVFCSHIAQAIENAKLYERLEAARKEALEANTLKEEFLHMTIHDLKSPLNVIQGYAEILKDRVLDEEVRRGALDRIERAVDHMSLLVKQVLRKGQIESTAFRVDRRPVSISAAADECLNDFSILAAKKRVALRKDDALPAEHRLPADPTALLEIFSNLVSNAIKYSPPGEEVRVALERRDGCVQVSVSDRGPGIGAQDRKQLFGKFQRGTAMEAEGTGYGLAIVKRLAEAHGGTVELDSESGRGSTFRVLLPEAQ